jgi:hypothetical protein
VLEALEALGPATIRRLVPVLYADVDRRLHPAAAHSTLAHLIKLVREGRVSCSGLPTFGAVFRAGRLRDAA